MHPLSSLAVISHCAIIKNVTILMDSPKSRLLGCFFFFQSTASKETPFEPLLYEYSRFYMKRVLYRCFVFPCTWCVFFLLHYMNTYEIQWHKTDMKQDSAVWNFFFFNEGKGNGNFKITCLFQGFKWVHKRLSFARHHKEAGECFSQI